MSFINSFYRIETLLFRSLILLAFTGTGQHKITEYLFNYVPSFLKLSDQIMFSSPAADVKNYGPPSQVRCSANSVSYFIHPLGDP